jgi:hypothetical protein
MNAFYEGFTKFGYVLTSEQVDKLTDKELLKYWEC